MNSQKSNNDIEQLKREIGFNMAFKATLGFYVAQTVATFLGIGTLFLIGWVIYKVLS